VRSALLDGGLAQTGLFEQGYLTHLVDAHSSGRRDYSSPLWSLLMFEAFLRKVGVAPQSGGGDATPPPARAAAPAEA
jgi:asparagine synthase (glutamine-hydrolysing)